MIRPFLFFLFSLLDHFGRSGTEMCGDRVVLTDSPREKSSVWV
jgi:hypothetical protein